MPKARVFMQPQGKPIRRVIAGTVAAIAIALLAACSTPAPKPVPPLPQGQASYVPLHAAGQARYVLSAKQTFSLGALQHWNDPVYPPALLPLRLPAQSLAVRLVIDTRGRVDAVQLLPELSATDPAHIPTFLAAIRDCTRSWAFGPLVIDTWKGPPGHGELISTVAKPYSLDYRFDFRVVDGKGVAAMARATSAR